MITVRIKFNKTGLSSYYSQLDLQRTMARALKKSSLPVWYSQGFNPHIYMTFTLPLSLGHESYCESMDFRLNEEVSKEKIISSLQPALPSGITLTDAGEIDYDARSIKWAKYKILLIDNNLDLQDIINNYSNNEKAIVIKQTKKGSKEINLKELIKDITVQNNNEITAFFPAGVLLNINPSLLLDYLKDKFDLKIVGAYITRLELFDDNMNKLQ